MRRADAVPRRLPPRSRASADADLQRISPLGRAHINPFGRYHNPFGRYHFNLDRMTRA